MTQAIQDKVDVDVNEILFRQTSQEY